MTPVDVLKLYLSTSMEDLSDTVYVLKLCLFTSMEDLSDTLDVLKLFLSTNMEGLSDTGRCTVVILIYKHGRPQ